MPLSCRLMPPRSFRERHALPEWEITDEQGKVVGWLAEHRIPTASVAFYDLVGVHPETGEHVRLQLSADLDERLEKLALFLVEPERFHQHFPSGGAAAKALQAKLGVEPWRLTGGRSGRHG